VWHFFRFGAYADDHHDRNELAVVARTRAQSECGIDFPPERIFVLGDTPHDITCARAIGARVLAVTTGRFSREDLAVYEPDWILDDLSDLPAVLSALELS
jgi:phosphoglycolate phosphatase-like HAD superfamily hydrolase